MFGGRAIDKITRYFNSPEPVINDLYGTKYMRQPGQPTRREKEVMDLLLQGLTNKEAASVLAVSPRTIEAHRGRVFSKLGVRNMAELSLQMLGSPTKPESVTRSRLLDLLGNLRGVQLQILKIERELVSTIEKLDL